MIVAIRARNTLLVLLSAACLLSPILAQAQDIIGRVIRTSGDVNAASLTGDERPLARGSNVLLDEIITTGARSSIQVRLNDGALITLEENSFFNVDEFEFDGEGGAGDTVIMTMTEGAMRTITGLIGEDAADTYEFNTPFASIGVRGTEYAVLIDTSGRTWFAVFDGSISLQPAGGGGATIVGLDGAADFVEMSDENTITQLEEAAAELDIVIATVLEPVTDDDLDSLPDPEDAVEVQLQQNQQGEAPPADDDGTNVAGQQTQQGQGGQLVDADGNALQSTDEDSTNQGRETVVNTVSEQDPDAFDDTVRDSVSPN